VLFIFFNNLRRLQLGIRPLINSLTLNIVHRVIPQARFTVYRCNHTNLILTAATVIRFVRRPLCKVEDWVINPFPGSSIISICLAIFPASSKPDLIIPSQRNQLCDHKFLLGFGINRNQVSTPVNSFLLMASPIVISCNKLVLVPTKYIVLFLRVPRQNNVGL